MAKILNFSDENLKTQQTFTDKGIDIQIDVYQPSEELVKAVHLAYQLKKPLLIMGEPGCGKTRLAEAVAYQLHEEKMYNHLFVWNIKSTTKAQDGLYQIDMLKRMYDVNIKNENASDIKKYIQYGALANAFMTKPNIDKDKEKLPNILLIDEIDKADIDFPNDLLLELDKKMFVIPELENKEIKAEGNLLIFITSNQEKALPPAFLRRCLYHYIDFPNETQLTNIVLSHYQHLDKEFVEKYITAFENTRENDFDDNDKKPSTSELLDWFNMIQHYQSLRGKDNLSEIEKSFIKELDDFDSDKTKIPYRQLLYKTLESYNKNAKK